AGGAAAFPLTARVPPRNPGAEWPGEPGAQVLRTEPGAGEGSLHSPEELKLLVQESREAGILRQAQQEVVARVLDIGDRRIADIMTARPQIEWIDTQDDHANKLRAIRECRHDQLVVARGSLDEPLGIVLKKDLLDQLLDGLALEPMKALREPLIVHEGASVFGVLEQFKRAPVRMAIVVDEYGNVEGVVTQTDLLEAMAGDLPESEGEEPDIVESEDGSLLIDGLTPAHAAFERLGVREADVQGKVHTIAGFALAQLGHLPRTGETFTFEDWRLEVVDMDGRRIDKLLARREPAPGKVGADRSSGG
ncbi:MAG TPA: hemolysin family protein, partial [Methylibium sp.]